MDNFEWLSGNQLPENPQEKEYFAFMKWFQLAHPLFYLKYWKIITMPQSGNRVSLSTMKIFPIDHLILVQIENEYYNRKVN